MLLKVNIIFWPHPKQQNRGVSVPTIWVFYNGTQESSHAVSCSQVPVNNFLITEILHSTCCSSSKLYFFRKGNFLTMWSVEQRNLATVSCFCLQYSPKADKRTNLQFPSEICPQISIFHQRHHYAGFVLQGRYSHDRQDMSMRKLLHNPNLLEEGLQQFLTYVWLNWNKIQ